MLDSENLQQHYVLVWLNDPKDQLTGAVLKTAPTVGQGSF